MTTSYCKQVADEVLKQLDGVFLFGSRALLEHCLVAYFARGHVLIEGPPGTAKTLTAKLLARTLSRSFNRIQFTSDMLPADILGAHIFAPASQQFNFVPGPIFADFILADEVNRTPPRTQSALLEAMEERQVTVEGRLFPLSPDFFVIATQNPHDFEGTFPLPEAQVDRFLFKLVVGHAAAKVEHDVLRSVVNGTLPPPLERLSAVELDRERAQEELSRVAIDASILDYCTRILEATRAHPLLNLGSSIRGGIALAKASRILALLRGRDFVVPDDIKELALPTLRHRIRLSSEAQVADVTEEKLLLELLQKVPFPE